MNVECVTPAAVNAHRSPVRGVFRTCAQSIAAACGSPWAFAISVAGVIVWGAMGHLFHYSDTWQLVINTSTTIVTFLMVFLIQSSQNRNTKAVHLKLDELLRAVRGARTSLVNLESMTDEELEKLQQEFQRLRLHAKKAKGHLNRMGDKTEPSKTEFLVR